jgi:peptidoglycan/xylan/chitin deacetylase (PgdA/CDA1 family)
VLVLCYHAVGATWPSVMSVPPARLQEQLEFLVQCGYRGATFTEAMIAPPHQKTLAVTFDDGYRSVLEAAPILSGLGLVGTVFAVTDWVERDRPMVWGGIEGWLGGPHHLELTPLSWQELRSLAESGWEIGSHTCSHPRLCSLDEPNLARELGASRQACEERLERACRSIAYPYGEVNARVMRAAKAAGYTAGAALTWRLRPGSALDWPRVGVWRTESFRYWQQRVAPRQRWLVGSVIGDGALRMDRLLRQAS